MDTEDIGSIDIDALMSETAHAAPLAKGNIFVLTYQSSADLNPEILHTLTAKSHDACCVGDVRHSLIHTWNPKRISWIEAEIKAWNDKENKDQIIFESIEAFAKTPDDHPSVLAIRKDGVSWKCDRLVRKLEIDMVPQGEVGEKRKRTATTPLTLDAPAKSQKLNKREIDTAKFLAKHSLGGQPDSSLERVIAALQATVDAKNETIAVMANAMRMMA